MGLTDFFRFRQRPPVEPAAPSEPDIIEIGDLDLPELPQELTKLTVNLVPTAMQSLHLAHAVTGDSMTDCINRALHIYGALMRVLPGKGAQFVADDLSIVVYRQRP